MIWTLHALDRWLTAGLTAERASCCVAAADYRHPIRTEPLAPGLRCWRMFSPPFPKRSAHGDGVH